MKKPTPKQLTLIAEKVINEPWGCGDPYLATVSESNAGYYRWLNGVIRYYYINNIVELGVYMATATIHMAIANQLARVVGIDIKFQDAAYNAARNYPNIWLIEGDTCSAAPIVDMVLDNEKIELLFIDSEHDGDTPTRELETYLPRMASPSLIVCDDIYDPRMEEFWRTKVPGHRLELPTLHMNPANGYKTSVGFGVSIYEG